MLFILLGDCFIFFTTVVLSSGNLDLYHPKPCHRIKVFALKTCPNSERQTVKEIQAYSISYKVVYR